MTGSSARGRERAVRPANGEIRCYTRHDGGLTYSLRITIPAWILLPAGHARRRTLPLGRDDQGWTEERALKELDRVLAHLTLGHWPIPDPRTRGSSDELSVVECGRAWIERHPEWPQNTRNDRLWRLRNLEPFWSMLTPSQADVSLVDDYRAFKVRESQRLQAAIDAGTPELWDSAGDSIGAVRRSLSHGSINKFIAMLAMILDEA